MVGRQPLAEALRDAIEALVGDSAHGRFGVAVSGGPDSMALLDLMARICPGRVLAATVDHGLRPESAAEAEMVAHFCAVMHIPHAILYPPLACHGNVQDWARTQRYTLLEAWRVAEGIDWLLTAHHADDQLETMLMRLNRGAGVGGLAGVRPRTGQVLRPLLSVRKADLRAHVEQAGIPHVEDPSNSDPRFDRAALRQALHDVDWLRPEAASRSAGALAQADAALAWTTERIASLHVQPEGAGWRLDHTDFPAELQRRLLLNMLERAGLGAPRGDAVDRLLYAAVDGLKASIGDWQFSGGAQWRLMPAPARRG